MCSTIYTLLQCSFEKSAIFWYIKAGIYGRCICKSEIPGSQDTRTFSFTKQWQQFSKVSSQPALPGSFCYFTFQTMPGCFRFFGLLAGLAGAPFLLDRIAGGRSPHWASCTSYNPQLGTHPEGHQDFL